MIHRFSSTAAVIVAIAFAVPVAAQVSGSSRVAAVWQAYEQLDFDLALARADSVIGSSEDYLPEELAEVHTISALVLIARNQPGLARQHFASALSIKPDLELDAMIASPQALVIFRSVKNETSERQQEAPPPTVRYVRVADRRPAAAYRSMLLPGWGQVYKGQRTRGYIMMGVWGTTVAGALAAHIVRHDRRQAYLEETDPEAVQDRFDTFNRWHKLRNNLAIGAALTWVVSYLDALIFDAPVRAGTSNRASLMVSFVETSSSPEPALVLRVPIR